MKKSTALAQSNVRKYTTMMYAQLLHTTNHIKDRQIGNRVWGLATSILVLTITLRRKEVTC